MKLSLAILAFESCIKIFKDCLISCWSSLSISSIILPYKRRKRNKWRCVNFTVIVKNSVQRRKNVVGAILKINCVIRRVSMYWNMDIGLFDIWLCVLRIDYGSQDANGTYW